eukprot:3431240-Amphidinium_carterae.2
MLGLYPKNKSIRRVLRWGRGGVVLWLHLSFLNNSLDGNLGDLPRNFRWDQRQNIGAALQDSTPNL